MKKYVSILFTLIIVSLQCFAQNENWVDLLKDKESPIHDYDIDFIQYLFCENPKDEFKNQKKFIFLNSFHKMYQIKDESLFKSVFIKRPNNNELLSLYLRRKIIWNTSNIKTKYEVVKNELMNFPEKNELLAFYYSEIFIQVLNNQRTYNKNNINLDYNDLKLTKIEGDILFLTAMRYCGNQITSYSKKKENCWRALEFISKLPSFDGKSFEEYIIGEFDDFLIDVDKRDPKISFKGKYMPEYHNAIQGYKKCQK
ncbi:hypothetical protein [Flammeovirga sp. SJP92]|uniref:hypothetical protein n=1 Tax=Flammeovirga sp. SJP92 TaxID=1775430 RepID=UPI0007880382|nr:hypothetical protein [Flammeovirga sp. SJP92]KXX69324.1 hypothetical protein AVL50_19790 [Flammeovirga sp. SJP92]